MEVQCWSNVEGVHTLVLPCGRVGGKKARRKNYSSLSFTVVILFVVSFVLSVSYLQSVACSIYCYKILHLAHKVSVFCRGTVSF